MEHLRPQLVSPSRMGEIREALGTSHAEFADLLGIPVETALAYEQGAEAPPPQVLRTLTLLLASHRLSRDECAADCWEVRRCSEPARASCPAYRLNRGRMCWLLAGSFCAGERAATAAGNDACRGCAVFEVLAGADKVRRVRPSGRGKHVLCGMPRPGRALSTS